MVSPLRDRKTIYEVNKHFHPSTNSEILVKIGPLDSEKQVLESGTLKNIFELQMRIAYSI